MLTIRLNRMGKNKRASFRVVVQEHTVAPGGRHVEILGSYDPHTKVNTFKKDRIQYWISKGAQPSETVHNLLVKNAIIEGKKRVTKIPKPKADSNTSPQVEEVAPVEATPEAKVEEAKAEEVKVEDPKVEEVKAEAPVTEEKKAEEKPVA